MPGIPCLTCKQSGRCKYEGNICMNTLFNLEYQECEIYEPDYYKGIEGVFV